jgi:hypothetical protein
MRVTVPRPADASTSCGIKILYHLQWENQDFLILAGVSMLSPQSFCLPFESCPNQSLFQQYFGVEFHHEDFTYVCAISTYEFACCFNLSEQIQYQLSHEKHKYGLDVSMPGRTSAWLLEQVHSHLVLIQDDNSKVFWPNQFATPAATIQMLINGAICSCLPTHNNWLKAYDNNNELCTVCKLILNPSLITNESLSKVNHNYCGALQKLLMCIEDGMLIFRKSIAGSNSYIRLQLESRELYNIILMAFHANHPDAHQWCNLLLSPYPG